MQFDFEDVLDYPLPEGFHFVRPEEYDMDKASGNIRFKQSESTQ